MNDREFDGALCAALQGNEAPAPELDAVLKAKLYQRQEQLEGEGRQRRVRLWWLPMVANLIVCGVPAAIFALPIMPLAAHLAAFALGWLALGGVVLTVVGLKCSDLKEQLTLTLPAKGKKEIQRL